MNCSYRGNADMAASTGTSTIGIPIKLLNEATVSAPHSLRAYYTCTCAYMGKCS